MLKGSNEVILCPLAVRDAMQYWLTNQLFNQDEKSIVTKCICTKEGGLIITLEGEKE